MNYHELNDALKKADLNFSGVDRFACSNKLSQVFITEGIIDILIWKYNVHNNKFKLISSNFGYTGITNSLFKSFLNSIKPCFLDYFTDFLASYIKFLTLRENIKNYSRYQFQSFVPIKLDSEGYYFSTLYIIPEITETKGLELHFLLIPLKRHTDEPITFNVLRDSKKDDTLTRQLKSRIGLSLEKILTREQIDIFNLLLRGYSYKKTAFYLNKKPDNILKYNRRINNRLSSHFDIDFNSATDAAKYYKNCFLVE
jgi:DNA-binding CsgD family transcriptional regulator